MAQRVVAAEPLIILAIAPALLFPTPARLIVLASVPMIWACARLAGDSIVPKTPMNGALWLLLAMVTVSLFATFDVRFSLGKVCGIALGALVFWAIVRWITTPRRLAGATGAFLLAAAALSLAGLLGTRGSYKFWDLYVVAGRLPLLIRGVPGAEEGFNPNAVSGSLVLFMPLQIALLATAAHRRLFTTGRDRWFHPWLTISVQVVLLILTAFTIVLMQSRSAWLGLMVAGVASLTWASR